MVYWILEYKKINEFGRLVSWKMDSWVELSWVDILKAFQGLRLGVSDCV